MNRAQKGIFFIINPRSGLKIRGRKVRLEIEKIASERKEAIEIVDTHYRGEGREWAKKAIKDGYNLIVAVGGDGTINDVASALVGQEIPFAIIPAGSGNGFARNFGFPLDPSQALEFVFNHHRIRTIDVGVVGNHYFFNVFGIGFDAIIAKEFEKIGIRGPLPYFWAGVRSYFKYDYPELDLTIEDELIQVSPLLLTFANGKQFGNGAIIAPSADETDGKLDMVFVPKLGPVKLLTNVSKLFKGTIEKVEDVKVRKIKNATIHATKPVEGHVDGEPIVLSNLVQVSIIPGALMIISH